MSKKNPQKHVDVSLHITSTISSRGKEIRSLKSHIVKDRGPLQSTGSGGALTQHHPPDQSGFSASLLTRDHNRILFCLVSRENRHCGWFSSVANSQSCKIQAPRTLANLPHKKKTSQTRNINIGPIHDVFVDTHGFESHYAPLPNDYKRPSYT